MSFAAAIHKIEFASVAERGKRWIVLKCFQDDSHSSLVLEDLAA